MGNIAGPYSKFDWLTMLMYKDSIRDMRREPNNFDTAIQKHTKLLRKYLTKEAA